MRNVSFARTVIRSAGAAVAGAPTPADSCGPKPGSTIGWPVVGSIRVSLDPRPNPDALEDPNSGNPALVPCEGAPVSVRDADLATLHIAVRKAGS